MSCVRIISVCRNDEFGGLSGDNFPYDKTFSDKNQSAISSNNKATILAMVDEHSSTPLSKNNALKYSNLSSGRKPTNVLTDKDLGEYYTKQKKSRTFFL